MPEFAHAPQPQHHPAAEPARPAPSPSPLPAAGRGRGRGWPAGHDFGRMAVHAPEPGHLQAKLVTNAPGDSYEQQADDIAETIFWSTTLPRHVNINRMQMMPVMQAFGPIVAKRNV